ncbi:uncharacterized protein BDR25DRAFT_392623 [Lindgomyces ingoldianus]|uniref:Uncharacterized protein n=1 Tax=Lindgomyces ingoldianus TaxID=673940 RepID=A0ACB6R2B0_9PLEO|nr:uncharacterized protein BDR25DRAFT_392623 [Lindgomyces ingoldianus]KAF2472647.1 hypothetical protein BDR25DRAFT_392623 [Lindgomyces ingoldianus]
MAAIERSDRSFISFRRVLLRVLELTAVGRLGQGLAVLRGRICDGITSSKKIIVSFMRGPCKKNALTWTRKFCTSHPGSSNRTSPDGATKNGWDNRNGLVNGERRGNRADWRAARACRTWQLYGVKFYGLELRTLDRSSNVAVARKFPGQNATGDEFASSKGWAQNRGSPNKANSWPMTQWGDIEADAALDKQNHVSWLYYSISLAGNFQSFLRTYEVTSTVVKKAENLAVTCTS